MRVRSAADGDSNGYFDCEHGVRVMKGYRNLAWGLARWRGSSDGGRRGRDRGTGRLSGLVPF